MPMKTKDFALHLVKEVDEDGTFEGYGSVFGVRDSYNEVVEPGAFVESLNRQKREGTRPKMLWQHDPWAPIGKWEDLAEDAKGLWGKGRLLKGVRQAEEAMILLREKAIEGLSIGYREIDTEPPENGGPRKLVKLDLLEVSIVSFPANRRARVDSVKNENWDRMEEFMCALRDGAPRPIKEFEELLRDAGASRTVATAIASHGYAKVVQSESGGAKAKEAAVARLRESVRGFLPAS
jgi:HK97 family phage prohead protease